MEIEIKKDCRNCLSFKSCKFVQAQNDLNKTNLMYSMFEYAEWNHLDANFYTYAGQKCKHYLRPFKDGVLDVDNTSEKIISDSVDAYMKENHNDIYYGHPKSQNGHVTEWTYGIGNVLKEKTKITDIFDLKNISLKLI